MPIGRFPRWVFEDDDGSIVLLRNLLKVIYILLFSVPVNLGYKRSVLEIYVQEMILAMTTGTCFLIGNPSQLNWEEPTIIFPRGNKVFEIGTQMETGMIHQL